MYDCAILGGGPAGVSAGIYASRKQLKTVFITKDFLSQSTVSEGIENWIGDINVPGPKLAQKFEEHLRAYAGDFVDIKTGEWIENVTKIEGGFEIKTDQESYQAKSILVATGSHRRQLPVPGADKFEHKGVTYCASCDGPVFAGQDVAVIGGGNAGFESAAQLLAYCKSVTLLNRGETFRADPKTVETVNKDEKMHVIKNTEILEVHGDTFVNGLSYKDTETGETKKLDVTGIFVEIGSVPTTEYVKDLVDLDDYNRVEIDPWTQRASMEGVWAAGDCTNILYHQNNIAAGDGVRALEDMYVWLKTQ
jgi:alkyl hydroperoxide reductase subunit F